jgi:hypothetical protein
LIVDVMARLGSRVEVYSPVCTFRQRLGIRGEEELVHFPCTRQLGVPWLCPAGSSDPLLVLDAGDETFDEPPMVQFSRSGSEIEHESVHHEGETGDIW